MRVGRRIPEHRDQNSGALIGPAVRNHDVFVCRHDPLSRCAPRTAQPNYLDHRIPRDVLRRRQLASCRKRKGRMAGAGQKHADHCGRILVAIAAIVFGIEHFLHPLGLPGVPLAKQMPAWIPGRLLIDYVTGAALVVAGAIFLLNRKTRTAATWVGAWILLLVLLIYGPVVILALSDPATPIKVEGINYFADTLLFAAAILAVASAARRSDSAAAG